MQAFLESIVLCRACQLISNEYLVADIGVDIVSTHRERAFRSIFEIMFTGRSFWDRPSWFSELIELFRWVEFCPYVHAIFPVEATVKTSVSPDFRTHPWSVDDSSESSNLKHARERYTDGDFWICFGRRFRRLDSLIRISALQHDTATSKLFVECMSTIPGDAKHF